MDIVNVLRNGSIVSGPIYNPQFGAWQCEVADLVENKTFVVLVMLDIGSDLIDSPEVLIKSGNFRKGARRRQVVKERSADDDASQDETS